MDKDGIVGAAKEAKGARKWRLARRRATPSCGAARDALNKRRRRQMPPERSRPARNSSRNARASAAVQFDTKHHASARDGKTR
jgi:hypothetical protein